MTTIDQTAFKQLEAEKRLLNPVLKAATHKAGRFGFRGDIAIKMAEQFADEARPPELATDQVMAVAQEGEPALDFMCGFLLSFEYLKPLVEAIKGVLKPEGKYFMFCDNIDLSTKYQVNMDGINFWILPINEATVYNEMLEMLYLEKTELKKLDTAGKLDRVADKAMEFTDKFPSISYEEGLKLMGPIRDLGADRPV